MEETYLKVQSYKPIDLGDTKGLSEEEWLKWREHGPHYADPLHPDYIPVTIGGSACSSVMGDNPWTSAHELFDLKSGRKLPKVGRQMNQEILDIGHDMEDIVARNFPYYMEENCGIKAASIKIINDTHMYQHPFYKFAVANFDRVINIQGNEGILECKTTHHFPDIELWKAGICPKKYEWQCRFYMATRNVSFAYIACMWGLTRDQMAVILIRRDLEIEKVLMETLKDFAECAEIGVEPVFNEHYMETLSKYYIRLYGEVDEKAPAVEFPDTEETQELFSDLRKVSEQKKMLNEQMMALQEKEAELCVKAKDYLGDKSNYGTFRLDENTVMALKIKIPKHRDSLDVEKFKSLYPDKYEEFIEETLNETALKKKYRKETSSCMIKGKVNYEKKPEIALIDVREIPVKEVL